jgi:TonB family protein
LTSPDRHVPAGVAALEDQVAAEAPKSGPPITPVAAPPPKAMTCDSAFSDAMPDVLDKPAFPDAAHAAGVYGQASVRVDLDEAGRVTGATVTQSSGNPALDDTAVASAHKSTFHPAIFACQAQKSSHVLDFDFSK